MLSAGGVQWKMAYQLSPITLTGGIAENMPGGTLPIIALTEASRFTDGLLAGPDNIELDEFFANFEPVTGSTLIDQDVPTYPFANQVVAANAVIAKPLTVSLQMLCTSSGANDYYKRAATMAALQASLYKHNSQGGTYTVATPLFTYTDALMIALRDVTSGESKQPQTHWQWDFLKPLLTEEQANQAQNLLMSKISSGTPIQPENPGWSGISNTIGQPTSLATPSLIPASTNSLAVNTPGRGVPSGPPQ